MESFLNFNVYTIESIDCRTIQNFLDPDNPIAKKPWSSLKLCLTFIRTLHLLKFWQVLLGAPTNSKFVPRKQIADFGVVQINHPKRLTVHTIRGVKLLPTPMKREIKEFNSSSRPKTENQYNSELKGRFTICGHRFLNMYLIYNE